MSSEVTKEFKHPDTGLTLAETLAGDPWSHPFTGESLEQANLTAHKNPHTGQTLCDIQAQAHIDGLRKDFEAAAQAFFREKRQKAALNRSAKDVEATFNSASALPLHDFKTGKTAINPNTKKTYTRANTRHTLDIRLSAIMEFFAWIRSTSPNIWPAQDTIIKNMKQRHGISTCRRSLNRDLAELERRGSIKRVRRLSRDKLTGLLKQRSTLYLVTDYGWEFYKCVSTYAKFVRGNFSQRIRKVLSGKLDPNALTPKQRSRGDLLPLADVPNMAHNPSVINILKDESTLNNGFEANHMQI